jgi:hypothetical protein
MMAFGEPVAYAVMGVLSGWLPLPTRDYVIATPERLPPEDERVDVIFGAVLIVPFFVGLMLYGYLSAGLAGAAGWSLLQPRDTTRPCGFQAVLRLASFGLPGPAICC